MTLSASPIFQNPRKILPVAFSICVSNVRASSVTITVVSTIGIQLIWTARLLDSQSKATVDDIKVVNKIHDRAHHDRFPLKYLNHLQRFQVWPNHPNDCGLQAIPIYIGKSSYSASGDHFR
ncbi:hypothetical protein T03_4956 [Trichinella britovi]|uniref:Uncharacterized protein n=1 Tax=Trichinella britovi TaxID=45882 RepID=A0A0V1CD09_TRIBR|nr:hypothetical protein T03_4956 [Trichinella britovi]